VNFTRIHSTQAVKSGPCTSCHDPHAAARKKLFVIEGDALCDRCHEKTQPQWRRLHLAAGGLDAPCTECHESEHRRK
jgi:predicted CXXCH cytochrome family protein